ncbi:MAG: polyprenyl diphosphate synthase [Anaerolineales bacterium]|nr:polyprenyl diphosphate synthase [Anaerolineales bacterium]
MDSIDQSGLDQSGLEQNDLPEIIPTHIAIIMDGNGRWALARGLPRLAGHRAGTENLRRVIEACIEFGIQYLTIYAFSTENWGRPQEEVQGLMKIFEDVIDRELQELHDQGIQLRHIGRLDQLDPVFQEKVSRALEYTRDNQRLVLVVAMNYGGRDEIVNAIQRMIQDDVTPEEVDYGLVSKYLFTAGVPDPDLIIRTSGELRGSNFLIWQGAYSEWYFPPVYWPDFDKDQLRLALEEFSHRERRYGRVEAAKTINLEDLIKRVRVALVLIPVGLAANILGGWVYCLLVALIIGVAAYEYALLYKASGLRPAVVLSVGAAVLIVIGQSFNRFELTALIFTASLMISVVYHLFEYERGRDQAATDFAVTISAVVYVGWLGSYFVSLRNLPDGFWWMMIVLPAVWLADTAAYIFGKRFGKHKMTRRLSPNKTWEGYLAGILVAAPGTALLALLWQLLGAGESISPWRGALLGASWRCSPSLATWVKA